MFAGEGWSSAVWLDDGLLVCSCTVTTVTQTCTGSEKLNWSAFPPKYTSRNTVLTDAFPAFSVILSFSVTNIDLADLESLKLARSVEPQGCGWTYPLKLGFIGVVNRSQQDINMEKALAVVLENEKEFFANHQTYRNIVRHQVLGKDAEPGECQFSVSRDMEGFLNSCNFRFL